MTPFELFNPGTLPNPNALTGPDGAKVLLDAARDFPGGPVMLVFALFWSPVGPGIPAGVLLARHIPLNPAATFGLYAVTDLLGALVCHPLFTLLRRHARRVRPLHWIGTRMMRLAMLGTRVPRPDDVAARGIGPALFRVATIGFGVDVYSAGMVANGLPVPRLLGWAAAIAGDLVWFAVLLGTSIAAAAAIDDDRIVGAVVIVAMLVIPPLARRLFPALRDPPATTAPVSAPAAEPRHTGAAVGEPRRAVAVGTRRLAGEKPRGA